MVSPLNKLLNSRTTRVGLAIRDINGAKSPIWCDNAGVTITPNSFYISTRDGISLRMLQWSSVDESPGIPILLIHGLASNARLWDGPARRLAELGHAVTAIDLRGHGLSDKPDTGYDMANIADDVLDVVNALGACRNANKTSLQGQISASILQIWSCCNLKRFKSGYRKRCTIGAAEIVDYSVREYVSSWLTGL
jgi:predicted alpha/beta hydrolase